MNIELIKEIMNTFGVGPEEAIKMSQMPEIQGMLSANYAMGQDEQAMGYAREMGTELSQASSQQGPAYGSLPGDTPTVTPGIRGPGGLFQSVPDCPIDTKWNGTTCATIPTGPSPLGPIRF
jgi:hypothetical protein